MILPSQVQKILSAFYSRGSISQCVRIALTILFLVLVNRTITTTEISILFKMVDPVSLIVASIMGSFILLLQALRWSMMLGGFGLKTMYINSLKMLLWGNVLAFVTPGRAGELFRGIEQFPKQKKLLFSATVIDRIFSIAAIVIFAIPALILQYIYIKKAPPVYFTAIITAALFVLGLGILVGSKPDILMIISKRLAALLTPMVRSLQKINISAISAISCIIHCILIIQTALLFSTFGLSNLFANVIIALLSYAFMLCVPITIANIGIREYAFTLFASIVYSNASGTLSIPTASLGVSGLILMINIVFPALAGLIWNVVPFRNGKVAINDPKYVEM